MPVDVAIADMVFPLAHFGVECSKAIRTGRSGHFVDIEWAVATNGVSMTQGFHGRQAGGGLHVWQAVANATDEEVVPFLSLPKRSGVVNGGSLT
ncbi:hypothetical protein GCM10007863_32710 [Dyella mobilis]|nr:hypothetical protein GCM10007863_32710 [Dyella mobilis]